MIILRDVRKSKGLTLKALSLSSEVPQRTIEDIERTGNAKVATLAKIAKALGCKLDDLWQD